MEQQNQNQTDGTNLELGSAEDIASAFFLKNKNHLKALIGKMSAKQLRRTIMNSGSYPFTAAGEQPRTKEEKEATHIFGQMAHLKAMIIMAEEVKRVEAALNKEESKQE